MATYEKWFGVVPYNHTFSHSKHLKRASVAQEAAMETYWHLMSVQKALCWDQHGYLQRDWMPVRNFLCHDTPDLCIWWNTWKIFFWLYTSNTPSTHPDAHIHFKSYGVLAETGFLNSRSSCTWGYRKLRNPDFKRNNIFWFQIKSSQ